MRKSFMLVCCIVFLMIGCENKSNPGFVDDSSEVLINNELNYQDEKELWDKVLRKYLNEPLWIERDIYDAGHNLMVPIHAAFIKCNNDWIMDIDRHFKSFVEDYDVENEISLLNKLHYYYAASRYLTLLVENDVPLEDYHLQLAELLKLELIKFWEVEPAWHWDYEDFIGIKQRLEYKLNLSNPRFSYDKAIIDEELFIVSIGSDLKYFYESQYIRNPILEEINQYGQRIFIQEGKLLDEGGWLFQENVWKDHPDYAFSGYNSIKEIEGGKRKVREFLNTDSSHGTRLPLQIFSVMKATNSMKEKQLLKEVFENIELQFYEKILSRKNEIYILNNFMDGSNGVFRYDYETNKGTGYGPHSLSGILMVGWYNFLNTERVSNIFKEMSLQFPIDIKVYSKYYLDKTNRVRNPLAKEPEAYYNGLYQLILLLSSQPLLKEE
ncbi:hypothetical protein [Sporosarcina sp. NCCP-2222]|uniref:hypothetical protein n=1 Tax=Sporosarcina sp. NCCP-2222 TaxID=2935073 RepID=UPI0020BDECC7|nr:hypothetical protein [Sporosarcina sp. NCCP-2222]